METGYYHSARQVERSGEPAAAGGAASIARMVANVWLGDVEPGPGRTSAYAPLEGAVHTQLGVGRRDSNWEWTQIED